MKMFRLRRQGSIHQSRGFVLAIALGGLVSGLPMAADAAVVYNPTGGTFNFPYPTGPGSSPVYITLDWNGDSSPEFSISLRNNYSQISIPEFKNNVEAILGRPEASEAQASVLLSAASPTPSSPAALQLGQLIGPSEAFSDSSGGGPLFRGEWKTFNGAAVPVAPGNFLTANSPAYVGARFLVGGETRYGWVRLSFSGGSQAGLTPGQATVSGMAYEDTGDAILAGQRSDWSSADFNRDGIVDSGDLAGWASGFGDGDAYDANGDGSSDGADFLIWQQQQGTSSFLGAAQPAATAVPEPTCGLLAIAGMALGAAHCQVRRRR
jgi:hypothetical protein